jgi:chromosome segregation ATPase|tara:strand:- start:301 stop:972 length:672 start_codon:yes stop_codon:yes gene_type:complete
MFASTQAQLEAHLQRLNAERGQLETWLTKLSKNREYLENIVAQCDDYEEISDILSRHRVLHDTHMDLQREVEESTLRLEKLRHEFGTMMQEQQNLLLVNNNKLAHMQKELDAIKREADTAESLRLGDETLRKQKITELGQVRNAIQHMYTRCESSRSGKAGAAAAKATKAAAEDEGEDAGEEEAQLASKLKNIQSRIMTLRSIVSGYDQWKEDGSLDGVIFET